MDENERRDETGVNSGVPFSGQQPEGSEGGLESEQLVLEEDLIRILKEEEEREFRNRIRSIVDIILKAKSGGNQGESISFGGLHFSEFERRVIFRKFLGTTQSLHGHDGDGDFVATKIQRLVYFPLRGVLMIKDFSDWSL